MASTYLLTCALFLFLVAGDLNDIQKLAVLGDSYASGIGAGVRGSKSGDTVCSRYTEAYGYTLNIVLPGYSTRDLVNVACSGADTPYFLDNEIKPIDANTDMATLTIGGNDIGFFDLLKACIFQFNHFTSCSDQLKTSGDTITNDFPALIDSDIAAILKQVSNEGFKLYLTGYAEFFNPSTTQCNNVSFNFWEKPENQANLTEALRTSTNGLVDSINDELSKAVDRANEGDQRKPVVFVNYNDAFEDHRYCDVGLTEPDPGETQEERWFQENWLFKQNSDPYSGNAIALDYQSAAESYLSATPTAVLSPTFQAAFGIANGKIDITGSGQWVFDALARAFHPNIEGQYGIMTAVSNIVTATPPGANSATAAGGTATSTAVVSLSKLRLLNGTNPRQICPNNAVDENPPNCVQPSTSSVPFKCSAGSNLGAATYSPATWCGCNTPTGTLYPTMTTGSGNAACAYTKTPDATVNPTPVSNKLRR